MTALYLYLNFNLCLYLYLYLLKRGLKALRQAGFSELAWQRFNQIRPLIHVAGRMSSAHCYGLGGSFVACMFALKRNPGYQKAV